MIADKILGKVSDKEAQGVVKVPFEWFELEKKRISKVASNGEKIGVCIEQTLNDKDIIAEDNETTYVVDLRPGKLIKTKVNSMTQMGRLCFELGNRHLSLKIEETQVMVPYDEPTFEYLKKLGFDVEVVTALFTDFIECKAHGSSHSHEHEHSHEDGHTHEHHHSHEDEH